MNVVVEVDGQDDGYMQLPCLPGEPFPERDLIEEVYNAMPCLHAALVGDWEYTLCVDHLDPRVLRHDSKHDAEGWVGDARVAVRPTPLQQLKKMGYTTRNPRRSFDEALKRREARALELILALGEVPEHAVTRAFEDLCAKGEVTGVDTLLEAAANTSEVLTRALFVESDALVEAAANGHDDICGMLIERGADVDRPARGARSTLRTPLWVAAMEGHTVTCGVLVAWGASLKVKMEGLPRRTKVVSPLFVAAANGHTETCMKLVDLGMDVNDPLTRRPALLAALESYHEDTLEALLHHCGADPNVSLYCDSTLLVLAAAAGSASMCGLLLRYGADINAVAAEIGPPLAAAATQTMCTSLVEELLGRGADVAVRDQDGRTPLFAAAREGLAAYCDSLIAAGANVNATAATGRTPIFAAISNYRTQSPSTFKTLLAHGADMHHRAEGGITVLMHAASLQLHHVVPMLAEGGVDVDSRCDSGRTALHFAVGGGCAATIRAVLACGAAVNAAGADGATPLVAATSQRDAADVVRVLLEAGADVHVVAGDGRTPLSVAAAGGCAEMCRMLLEHGADVDEPTGAALWPPLLYAAQQGHVAACRVLLAHGAAVDATNGDGWSSLIVAAQEGLADACAVLLKHGADHTLRRGGDGGWTALAYAKEEGHTDVVRVLQDGGAVC